MQKREVYTFSPGPCILPLELLMETKKQIKEKKSVLQLSPHSSEFKALVEENKMLLREILEIPDDYEVFFMEGGASCQFSAIPINFLKSENDTALYYVTGIWSDYAMIEAVKYGKVVQLNQPLKKGEVYNEAFEVPEQQFIKSAKYLYYCDNETVHGVEYSKPPESYGVPLVTDMTSNFLSKPIDVSKFALIYAASQKNYAPPGLCTIIIRKDFLSKVCLPKSPSSLHYINYTKIDKTPALPVFTLYFVNLYLKWIKAVGGIEKMYTLSLNKSEMIYDVIDKSDGFYRTAVKRESRSRMNIPFNIRKNDEKIDRLFLEEAASRGLIQLAGFKSIGGMRASFYNGMPLEGVEKLRTFMIEFKQKYQNVPKL